MPPATLEWAKARVAYVRRLQSRLRATTPFQTTGTWLGLGMAISGTLFEDMRLALTALAMYAIIMSTFVYDLWLIRRIERALREIDTRVLREGQR